MKKLCTPLRETHSFLYDILVLIYRSDIILSVAMPAAMLTITAALYRFSILFIPDHASYRKSDKHTQNCAYHKSSHTDKPPPIFHYFFFTSYIFFIIYLAGTIAFCPAFNVLLSLYGRTIR